MRTFLNTVLLLATMTAPAWAQVNAGQQKPEADLPFTMTQVASFNRPWRIAFLPDGRMLVTERTGTIRIIDHGKLLPDAVKGTPTPWVRQDGGYFDIAIHPDYKKIEPLGYKPDEAKKLLAEAGFPDGIDIEINCKPDPSWEQAAVEAMAEQWKAGGIRAILPHVHDFLPVHDLRSLEDLAEVLRKL